MTAAKLLLLEPKINVPQKLQKLGIITQIIYLRIQS